MRALNHLAIVMLCSIATAHAAESVTVLGLPLGGKFKSPLKTCKNLSPGKFEVRGPCWLYSTVLYRGVRTGSLIVADTNSLPGWAAYAEFKADVDKHGVLTQFTVISPESRRADEIIDSISARFGRPTSSSSNHPLKWHASWEKQDIGISVQCSLAEKCYTRFTSADVAADERAQIRKIMNANAARPVSP